MTAEKNKWSMGELEMVVELGKRQKPDAFVFTGLVLEGAASRCRAIISPRRGMKFHVFSKFNSLFHDHRLR